jgi:thiol-disulfide isomerase/thioredoxin
MASEDKFKDNVVMLKKGDFDDNLKLNKKGKFVILYFADWCGHCQHLKPDYQKLADNANGFTVAAVNSDSNDGLIEKIQSKGDKAEYPVQGFPTIVSYYDGNYFSTYGPSEGQGAQKFRTFEDLMEYANGIGTAKITYR